jgi:hypothetical protein
MSRSRLAVALCSAVVLAAVLAPRLRAGFEPNIGEPITAAVAIPEIPAMPVVAPIAPSIPVIPEVTAPIVPGGVIPEVTEPPLPPAPPPQLVLPPPNIEWDGCPACGMG